MEEQLQRRPTARLRPRKLQSRPRLRPFRRKVRTSTSTLTSFRPFVWRITAKYSKKWDQVISWRNLRPLSRNAFDFSPDFDFGLGKLDLDLNFETEANVEVKVEVEVVLETAWFYSLFELQFLLGFLST